MNASDSLGNLAAQKKIHADAFKSNILAEINLIEGKSEEVQLNGEKIDLVNPTEFIGILLPASLVITTGAFIIFQLLRKTEQSLTSDFLSRLNPAPCTNCHFFTMNAYLKCAVNPATVLTQQAIDCPDYRPRNSKGIY